MKGDLRRIIGADLDDDLLCDTEMRIAFLIPEDVTDDELSELHKFVEAEARPLFLDSGRFSLSLPLFLDALSKWDPQIVGGVFREGQLWELAAVCAWLRRHRGVKHCLITPLKSIISLAPLCPLPKKPKYLRPL